MTSESSEADVKTELFEDGKGLREMLLLVITSRWCIGIPTLANPNNTKIQTHVLFLFVKLVSKQHKGKGHDIIKVRLMRRSTCDI